MRTRKSPLSLEPPAPLHLSAIEYAISRIEASCERGLNVFCSHFVLLGWFAAAPGEPLSSLAALWSRWLCSSQDGQAQQHRAQQSLPQAVGSLREDLVGPAGAFACIAPRRMQREPAFLLITGREEPPASGP